jgi:hypothetical protein
VEPHVAPFRRSGECLPARSIIRPVARQGPAPEKATGACTRNRDGSFHQKAVTARHGRSPRRNPPAVRGAGLHQKARREAAPERRSPPGAGAHPGEIPRPFAARASTRKRDRSFHQKAVTARRGRSPRRNPLAVPGAGQAGRGQLGIRGRGHSPDFVSKTCRRAYRHREHHRQGMAPSGHAPAPAGQGSEEPAYLLIGCPLISGGDTFR